MSSEIAFGKPIDRSSHDPMDSYTFALCMNELLRSHGEVREGGIIDASWHSIELGKYFVLARNNADNQITFTLHMTDSELDDEGYERESAILFDPEKGVIGLMGDICAEAEMFSDDFGTELDIAEGMMRACIDTYSD